MNLASNQCPRYPSRRDTRRRDTSPRHLVSRRTCRPTIAARGLRSAATAPPRMPSWRGARWPSTRGRRRKGADVAEYKPDLPEGVTLPEGASIDVENPRFKALHDLASRENLSQSAFSGLLGI